MQMASFWLYLPLAHESIFSHFVKMKHSKQFDHIGCEIAMCEKVIEVLSAYRGGVDGARLRLVDAEIAKWKGRLGPLVEEKMRGSASPK